jgi:spermidine/putrescine transport system ATP-binding protein
MTLSDRLAVMNEGKIEQVGTPKEIYQNPATQFVADFIGDTNLFDCSSNLVNGHAEVSFKGTSGVSFTSSRFDDEGDVTVSVRPEEIDLSETDGGLFGATVTERYFQGDHTDYVVVPDDDSLPSIEVTIHGKEARFEEGDAVSVDFDGESAPVFFT